MESRPFKVGHGLILEILERLSLREAVRVGVVSTGWRHLPQRRRLPGHCPARDHGRLHRCGVQVAGSVSSCRAECKCDCKTKRAVKTVCLCFYPLASHLISIGHAVEDTVNASSSIRHAELGQQFMSFSRACPVAFRWLTGLSLTSLEFGDSDLPSLMGACDKLKHLSLRSCRLVGHSALKIDVPNSAPFLLSECFSMNTRNLSTLHLIFGSKMIWIQPELPKQLTAIFRNLTYVALWGIFPECDLSWTLLILEAAPALQMLIHLYLQTLRRLRMSLWEAFCDRVAFYIWPVSIKISLKQLC